MHSIMRPVCLLLLLATLASGQKLVLIPERSQEVVDAYTGIKVSVTIRPFLIAPTEITQKEYTLIMGRNPSFYRGDDRPVETVSWWDAIRYCNRRSAKEGLQLVYDVNTGRANRNRNGYRLPTEAEWTAAFGGQKTGAQLGDAGTKDTDKLLELVRRGTAKVGSHPPNRLGLYDMLGNVWEWCSNYFDPAENVTSSDDPEGPARGVARVIHGGSFATAPAGWSKGFRSSLEPATRSRYTGFRVCRSATAKVAGVSKANDAQWFAPYNQPPSEFANATGGLSPLAVGANADEWRREAARLRKKWLALLGAPAVPPPAPAMRVVETFHEPAYTGTLGFLQVEQDFAEKIFLMRPPNSGNRPLPVVIVPFYDVDAAAGANLGGRRWTPPGVRSYAYLAVQRGYMAVAIRWFGESYGESYSEAVANLRLRHPTCTGMGKWLWDAQRLVDYLYSRADVDRSRIGIMGHSLGGKLALYAAAMESRITVAVASEPGIGFSHSNYDDFWYLGDALKRAPAGTDQHELLALVAPRPFLLIGGDSADGERSWHYINAARPVYELLAAPHRIGYLNHHSGHSPTPDAVRQALDWLQHFF